ncbi:MAG: hypothetical protein BWY63_01695 [Chloroflexi bacterium ADurb.Bin360]|nr:MAG: hypothetical protein BWY63_01695 [Chloroflexi bacterium ADurb.Bin360]
MEFEQEVVISAPTVEEAIILGLARLGLTRDAAEIEVLDEGSKGFLGLGTREARVQVKQRQVAAVTVDATASEVEMPVVASDVAAAPAVPELVSSLKPGSSLASAGAPVEKLPLGASSEKKLATEKPQAAEPQAVKPVMSQPAPTDNAPAAAPRESAATELEDCDAIRAIALEVATHFFEALDLQATAEWREEEEDRQTLWISVRGKDADVLVGPQAQTLDAVQYLLRTVVRHKARGNYDLVLDADGYRERRLRSLTTLAHNMADKAVRLGKAVQLRPMPAADRRVIHIALRSDPCVTTQSSGGGHSRAVTIIPEDSDAQ